MSTNKVDGTAIGIAFLRGLESSHSENIRLFEDNYALKLLPGVIFKIFSGLLKFKFFRAKLVNSYEKTIQGIYGSMISRTKYFDDAMINAISNGMENIIILGAGLDTRAYRVPNVNKTKVFELDRPSMIEYKKEQIVKITGSLPSYITYVPINFNEQTINEVLEAKGLDVSKPSLFIWEGVTQYITEESVKSTLQYISKTCQGSIVVFTYVTKSVIDGTSNIEGVDTLIKKLVKANTPWIFGIDPENISEFIRENNLSLLEDIGAPFLVEKYLKSAGRNLTGYEIERFVCAKV